MNTFLKRSTEKTQLNRSKLLRQIIKTLHDGVHTPNCKIQQIPEDTDRCPDHCYKSPCREYLNLETSIIWEVKDNLTTIENYLDDYYREKNDDWGDQEAVDAEWEWNFLANSINETCKNAGVLKGIVKRSCYSIVYWLQDEHKEELAIKKERYTILTCILNAVSNRHEFLTINNLKNILAYAKQWKKLRHEVIQNKMGKEV